MTNYFGSRMLGTSAFIDNVLMNSLFEKPRGSQHYPPYNLLQNKEKNSYQIEVACAGFTKENLSVFIEEDVLVISGNSTPKNLQDVEYVHRGIAKRNFELKFFISRDYEVSDVTFENGLIRVNVNLKKEAESPRKVLQIT